MVTLSGSTVSVWHGLALILLCCLYGLAAMACIVSLALLFSTLTDSSLTALIATVVVYSVIQVLISFSYFDWLRPWVFPSYFLEYVSFFRDPIYWTPILKGLAAFAAWSGGLTWPRTYCSGARTCCSRGRVASRVVPCRRRTLVMRGILCFVVFCRERGRSWPA